MRFTGPRKDLVRKVGIQVPTNRLSKKYSRNPLLEGGQFHTSIAYQKTTHDCTELEKEDDVSYATHPNLRRWRTQYTMILVTSAHDIS